MDGLGNDFVIFDNRKKITRLNKNEIIKIADRNFIGCDQLIFINKSNDFDAELDRTPTGRSSGQSGIRSIGLGLVATGTSTGERMVTGGAASTGLTVGRAEATRVTGAVAVTDGAAGVESDERSHTSAPRTATTTKTVNAALRLMISARRSFRVRPAVSSRKRGSTFMSSWGRHYTTASGRATSQFLVTARPTAWLTQDIGPPMRSVTEDSRERSPRPRTLGSQALRTR